MQNIPRFNLETYTYYHILLNIYAFVSCEKKKTLLLDVMFS